MQQHSSESNTWIKLSAWHSRGKSKDSLHQQGMQVRLSDVRWIESKKKYEYVHFNESAFGTSDGSPDYGIVHPDSLELVQNLYKKQKSGQKRFRSSSADDDKEK